MGANNISGPDAHSGKAGFGVRGSEEKKIDEQQGFFSEEEAISKINQIKEKIELINSTVSNDERTEEITGLINQFAILSKGVVKAEYDALEKGVVGEAIAEDIGVGVAFGELVESTIMVKELRDLGNKLELKKEMLTYINRLAKNNPMKEEYKITQLSLKEEVKHLEAEIKNLKFSASFEVGHTMTELVEAAYTILPIEGEAAELTGNIIGEVGADILVAKSLFSIKNTIDKIIDVSKEIDKVSNDIERLEKENKDSNEPLLEILKLKLKHLEGNKRLYLTTKLVNQTVRLLRASGMLGVSVGHLVGQIKAHFVAAMGHFGAVLLGGSLAIALTIYYHTEKANVKNFFTTMPLKFNRMRIDNRLGKEMEAINLLRKALEMKEKGASMVDYGNKVGKAMVIIKERMREEADVIDAIESNIFNMFWRLGKDLRPDFTQDKHLPYLYHLGNHVTDLRKMLVEEERVEIEPSIKRLENFQKLKQIDGLTTELASEFHKLDKKQIQMGLRKILKLQIQLIPDLVEYKTNIEKQIKEADKYTEVEYEATKLGATVEDIEDYKKELTKMLEIPAFKGSFDHYVQHETDELTQLNYKKDPTETLVKWMLE